VLADAGIEPISERVTPHSLRRTYASLRAALRDDPVYIVEQLGHRDARFTVRVYQRAAKRRERLSGEHLAAFDRALEWAGNGQGAQLRRYPEPATVEAPRLVKTASSSQDRSTSPIAQLDRATPS
jgi:hypothetical protein